MIFDEKQARAGWTAACRCMRCAIYSGHSNVAQTSTYLATTSASLHDAMQTYETALQQIATGDGKGGRKRPRKAKQRDKRTNKTAVGRDQPTM